MLGSLLYVGQAFIEEYEKKSIKFRNLIISYSVNRGIGQVIIVCFVCYSVENYQINQYQTVQLILSICIFILCGLL